MHDAVVVELVAHEHNRIDVFVCSCVVDTINQMLPVFQLIRSDVRVSNQEQTNHGVVVTSV